MAAKLAIIAGSGNFPLYALREARRRGREAVVIGLKGWVDAPLAGEAAAYEEVGVGQIGRLLARLKAHGVGEAILAGKVTKKVLLKDAAAFDLEGVKLLASAKDKSAPSLIAAIAARLKAEGVNLLDSSVFLRSALCPVGVLGRRKPSADEQRGIDVGMRAARALAAVDVGQTVVVKDGVVVAVEALEGTDAAVRRAHQLAGEGLVVVKTASPRQDRRLDLPVIGMETLKVLGQCGVSCLAVEAGATLLLEREALIRQADSAGIAVTGVKPAA